MNGVIPLWKPKGMTSHDCVARIRRILKTKKVGHTGTLDPEAEGVLPICIGKATKIASLLTDQVKGYEAELSLGQQTTTEDHIGEVISSRPINPNLTIEQCQRIMEDFKGEIKQIPPMYSAVKVNGKKLYEYAREGIEVERPSRVVTIYSISMLSRELTWYNHNDVRFSFKVSCSSGTYIRTLCVNIGEKLGYPAHMSNLIRTQAGSFHLTDTITLEELESHTNRNDHLRIIPIADALPFPSYIVSQSEEFRYKHGQVLNLPKEVDEYPMFKVLNQTNELLAIYQKHPSKVGKMKPFKVL